jgi:hypothetical protein
MPTSLFGVAKEESRMSKLVRLLAAHGTCATKSYALFEAERNIELKRCGKVEVLRKFLTVSVSVENKLAPRVPVPLEEKDIPILGGAIGLSYTHLLTGDKADFGLFFGETILGVCIHSPRMIAEFLVSHGLIEKEHKDE